MRKTAAGSAACLALTAAFAAGATGASAAPARSSLPGSQPAWANSRALIGAAPSTDVVHARVYLPWRNQSALDALTRAVSTPGSPSYRHFLTPQQFRAQFAPAQADVVAVQQWLRGAGLSVADTPDNGHYVAVEGTVAQAQVAFGTTLGRYTAFGQSLRAPESTPSVPGEVAGKVSAVVGLDDSAKLAAPAIDNGNGNSPKQNHGAPGVGFRAGRPCASYYGSSQVATETPVYGKATTPLAPCGYTPAQVRGLYGLTPAHTGAGQTVAFVGANASPTLVKDVTAYSTAHGLPAPNIRQIAAPGIYKHPDTPRQIPGDYYGEETLDAEAIHSTAPNATLLYVASSNANQDFDAAINHIVDKHLAPIISISYGWSGENLPRGFITSVNNTFQQAVAEGIGVFVSSGDSGDEKANTGIAQPDFYADSPYVTAVGGTSAAVIPTAGTAPATASGPLFGGNGATAMDAAANWKRGFEVGWQTGLAAVSGPIDPTDNGSRTYTLGGTVPALPGRFNGGEGGGVSTVFAKPSYQANLPGSGRLVPDISGLADPNTGFLVGQTQSFPDGTYYDEYRIGGTSVSAPLMAGMAADANQANGGTPLGFLNPLIYGAYAGGSGASPAPVSTSPLYDVDQLHTFCGGDSCTFTGQTPDPIPAVIRVNYADNVSAKSGLTYSVRTQEADPLTTLPTVQGYDTGSGVGTPNGNAFFTALIAAATR